MTNNKILFAICLLALTSWALANPYADKLDAGINWNQCQIPAASPVLMKSPTANQAWDISADGADASSGEQRIRFSGDVQASQPGQKLFAQSLIYDRATGDLSSKGAIYLQVDDLRLTGDNLLYKPAAKTGQMVDAEYRIPSLKIRGTAKLAALTGQDTAHFQNITYTRCPPGNNGFVLSAKKLDIDRTASTGTFHGAKLTFLDVPVFYVPKMTLPLDDRRISGVLPPRFGYSNKNGLDLSIPYYFNLAENYDATLQPRIVGKRGIALGGEFRFLSRQHSGKVLAELLANDRLYEDDGMRGALSLKTHSTLTKNLTADITLNYLSDDDYLDDLGDSLAVSSTRHLLNRAALTYHQKDWDVYAEVRHYNTLDDTISDAEKPYSQLPNVRFYGSKPDGLGGLTYSLFSEYVYFYKEDFTNAQRLDIAPEISLPIHHDWWYIEPAISGRYTSYQLSEPTLTGARNLERSLYSVSLDSGLFFERESNWFGQRITQTLEPRLYYTYTPYKDQSEIPVFDTGLLDFNFDNLFRSNRFNGPDRVADANQITLALSSSLISNQSGQELLRASIGQTFFMQEQQVTLPGVAATDFNKSSFLAQISANPTPNWSFRAGIQHSPDTTADKLQQMLAQATYRGQSGQSFNASYRLREGVIEQTDLSATWPVTESTRLIGRWNYSLQDDKTLEAVAGIEYGRCCWKVRAVVRHYLDDDGTAYNNSALLQLELNGLGQLGNDIDSYLNRTIYGY